MPITGLDHAMLAVSDLDAAGAALTRSLGLPVRRGGTHPGWGTANSVLPLERHYVELITIVDDAVAGERDAGRRMRDVLDGSDGSDGTDGTDGTGGGWLAFVLAAQDLRGTWEDVRRAGVQCAEPVGGRALRPDGTFRDWAVAGHGEEFRTGALPSLIEYGPAPDTEPVTPPADEPAVTVTGVAGVDVAVDDLEAALVRYGSLLGGPPESRGTGTAAWTLPDGVRLVLHEHPPGTGPRQGLHTVALAVPDLTAARAVLDARGTPSTPDGPGSLLVDPVATAPARIALTETITHRSTR